MFEKQISSNFMASFTKILNQNSTTNIGFMIGTDWML